MRKAFSSAFEIPRGIILPLLFLLILIAIAAGPVKGQIADSDAYMRSAMPDWLWGCEGVGEVSLDGLGQKMQELYTNCKSTNDCKCESVTLNNGAEGDYYVITSDSGVAWLENHGLGDYGRTFLLISTVSTYCQNGDYRLGHNKLILNYFPSENYYEKDNGGGALMILTKADDKIVCNTLTTSSNGGFSVANGAKIDIKPKWYDADATGGEGLDLEIKITGGTYTNNRDI